jgi:hypothetical protein
VKRSSTLKAVVPHYRTALSRAPSPDVTGLLQLLSVNDNLVPAEFDELVLGEQAEESLLMPDE